MGKKTSYVAASKAHSLTDLRGKSGRISEILVEGDSMKPFLLDGDMINIGHRVSGVRAGDIAVFYRSGLLVVHRVVRVKTSNGSFQTKGDNLLFFDHPWVANEEMIGIVMSISRKGRVIQLRKFPQRLLGIATAKMSCLIGHYPRFFGLLLRLRSKGCAKIKK